MTYTVKATGLRKAFRGKTVLDGVDLNVPAGRIAALLGPNGAGKTTLIRILATLLRPDAGSATVAGHDLLADPVGVRRSISLTGQPARRAVALRSCWPRSSWPMRAAAWSRPTRAACAAASTWRSA
jgi:ABC-type multidrug transport system ATPase subunit